MTVRVGLIGTGGIAAGHLENLISMPNVEAVAPCDLDVGQIERVRMLFEDAASRRSDAPACTGYGMMSCDEVLDAVYFRGPRFALGEPEAVVITTGVPMLVEKPVALDAAAARTLECIRERVLLAAAGCRLRHAVASGRLRA